MLVYNFIMKTKREKERQDFNEMKSQGIKACACHLVFYEYFRMSTFYTII